jgi:hypothetical protein
MLCEFDGLATLIAVMVTLAGFGMVDGAAYSPAVEMNPAAALPPATPSTAHITVLSVLPLTTAVYCDCVPSVTLLAPLIAIVTGDGVGAATSVTITLCDVAVLFALVAAILMLDDVGIVAGAL